MHVERVGRRKMEPNNGLPRRGCLFLVSEEQEGNVRGPDREVHVLGLQDR